MQKQKQIHSSEHSELVHKNSSSSASSSKVTKNTAIVQLQKNGNALARIAKKGGGERGNDTPGKIKKGTSKGTASIGKVKRGGVAVKASKMSKKQNDSSSDEDETSEDEEDESSEEAIDEEDVSSAKVLTVVRLVIAVMHDKSHTLPDPA